MISIIIPCYNCAKYIVENLSSIKNQSYSDWECIIVDDGSTDDSSDVIKKFIYNDNRFKYLYQENKGMSGARNTGARSSSNNLLLFIDADDYISKDLLKKAIQLFDKHKDLHVAIVDFCVFTPDSSIYRSYNRGTVDQMLIKMWLPGAGVVMKKEVWERVGGYSEDDLFRKGCEDVDFWVKNTSYPLTTKKIDGEYYYYRRHNTSMVTTMGKYHYKLYKYIAKKNKAIYKKDSKIKNKFLSRGYYESGHYYYLNRQYFKAIYLTIISIYLHINHKNKILLRKCILNFILNR